ncbi:MAG: hypothetical protein KKB51_00180 [Candidatus Riflebacteria bacterium]|nr:hypothetical protein [Candidatus Riflebacteria bacterium]
MRILLFAMIFQLFAPIQVAAVIISPDDVVVDSKKVSSSHSGTTASATLPIDAKKISATHKKTLKSAKIGPNTVAVETKATAKTAPVTYQIVLPQKLAVSADTVAVSETALSADSVAVGAKPALVSPDDIAVEGSAMPTQFSEPQRIKTPPAQIVQYARTFWDEADEQITKRNINISGTKTFEMKRADVSGDIGHFSSQNYDSIPGFKLDQSLHLEVSGNITETAEVHAVLDDKDDEDRRFTVNIDGPVWKFVMGDFPLALDGTEFALFRKEVRGIMAQGAFHERFQSTFLFSQSKGQARREQFRGAGQQQEFRMAASPIVQNSEKVMIDGVVISRGTDYFIDYEDGVIKFLPHMLPLEMTRWVVVEYEVSDKDLAFSRNLFGTRQVYQHNETSHLGLTWLQEVDSSTPKSGADASGTATPMQHDVISFDTKWQLTPSVSMNAETAMSQLDPNRNSEATAQDKALTGHATRFGVTGKTARSEGDVTYRRIDNKFKVVGREGGVLELGERGLVNDIMSGRARLSYKFTGTLTGFADAEKSETNLDNDLALQAVDFKDYNTGFVWLPKAENRFEVRAGRQQDQETGPTRSADMVRDTSTAVWDRKFGKLITQSKLNKTGYTDALNLASDSEVIEMGFTMGAKADETFAWNTGISRVTVDDGLVENNFRSETRNYNLDLSYEPNRELSARGLFQWRSEDDYLANSRANTEIADSQIRYEPNRDLRTQLKYKIENTSKVLRDPSLDPQKYILPPSLPNSEQDKLDIVGTFENPVQKTTANFITDYRINRYLQAYFDWRRRDLLDQATDVKVSSNDRRTWELRYTPFEKMMLTTEYEEGFNRNHEPQTELRDSIKSIQLRHEFSEGYILDATYEEKDENDVYIDTNDIFTKTKILGVQRVFSQSATMELALQQNNISSFQPSTEFEKRLAVVLTPFSRNQRYRFFVNHKDISASQSGTKYEAGLNFSQFIGTDTIIDGEVKKVNSSKTLVGNGYDATVFNAKMVVTF